MTVSVVANLSDGLARRKTGSSQNSLAEHVICKQWRQVSDFGRSGILASASFDLLTHQQELQACLRFAASKMKQIADATTLSEIVRIELMRSAEPTANWPDEAVFKRS